MKPSKDVLKKILFFQFFLFFCNFLFAQNFQDLYFKDLSKIDPKWKSVVSGKLISDPLYTSYGTCFMLDGRTLMALTGDGKIYWQKGFRQKPTNFITVTRDDFIYCVTGTNTLHMVNPNGLVLWQIETPETIISTPKCGRDGRVFITSENTISCYGLNGKSKWILHLDPIESKPLQELPDGSLLVFLQKKENNCSKAIRISPFGKILEEIIFTGIVNSCLETKYGVLLGFTNGNIGLCSVTEDSAISKWILQLNLGCPVVMCQGNNNIYILFSNSNCCAISYKNDNLPTLLWKNYLEGFDISQSSNVKSNFYSNRINFLNEKSAISLYQNGKIHWQCNLNEKSKYFFTVFGTLLEFDENWIVKSYTVSQSSPNSKDNLKKINISPVTSSRKYPKSYIKKENQYYTLNNLIDEFSKENYGSLETVFFAEIDKNILDIQQFYMQDKQKKLFYNEDFSLQKRIQLITLAGMTGTTNYTHFLNYILQNETDSSVLLSCLKSIENYGYDFEGTILLQIEEFLQQRISNNNQLLIPLCDCVFSICKSMGKPAIFNKGKSILFKLNSNSYESPIRDYAKQTLQKLIALQI